LIVAKTGSETKSGKGAAASAAVTSTSSSVAVEWNEVWMRAVLPDGAKAVAAAMAVEITASFIIVEKLFELRRGAIINL